MKNYFRIAIFLIFILSTACNSQSTPTMEPTQPVESTTLPAATDTPMATLETNDLTLNTDTPEQSNAPDCLMGEVSPIGMSIADDYETVDYDQVITWFCNGAEFEDILVALETETRTDTSAAEMLQMLVDGFTWEEIWQISGLTE